MGRWTKVFALDQKREQMPHPADREHRTISTMVEMILAAALDEERVAHDKRR
jgi:hypothetical protein